jgi:hypothetical protein
LLIDLHSIAQDAKTRQRQSIDTNKEFEFGVELSECLESKEAAYRNNNRGTESKPDDFSFAKLDRETTMSVFFDQLHAARLEVYSSGKMDSHDPMQVLAVRLFNKS